MCNVRRASSKFLTPRQIFGEPCGLTHGSGRNRCVVRRRFDGHASRRRSERMAGRGARSSGVCRAPDRGRSDFFIGGSGHDRVRTSWSTRPAMLTLGCCWPNNFPGISPLRSPTAGWTPRFVARIPPPELYPPPSSRWRASPTASLADAHLSNSGPTKPAGLAVDASGNAQHGVADDGSRVSPDRGSAPRERRRRYALKVSVSGAVSKVSNALDPAINRVGGIAVDKVGAIYLTVERARRVANHRERAISHEQRGGELHRALRDEARRDRPDRSARRPILGNSGTRGRSAAAAFTRQTSSRPISIRPVMPLRSMTAETPTSRAG